MVSTLSMADTSTVARTLQEGVGHADLERRFTDLVDDIRNERWESVDEHWPALAADFEQHFAFEERDMFPRYCAEDPARRSHTRRLTAEHVQLRERIEGLSRLLAARQITAEAIGAFADALAAHSAREDRTVYAWLAARHL